MCLSLHFYFHELSVYIPHPCTYSIFRIFLIESINLSCNEDADLYSWLWVKRVHDAFDLEFTGFFFLITKLLLLKSNSF